MAEKIGIYGSLPRTGHAPLRHVLTIDSWSCTRRLASSPSPALRAPRPLSAAAQSSAALAHATAAATVVGVARAARL